jgi:cupin 2 domain-containing protein
METENLLDNLPHQPPQEVLTTILQADGLRLQRIVSQGHASPPGFWYDQDDNEWVMLLAGSATVEFEGDAEPRRLRPGSYLNIPAHARHRVLATDPRQKTVWLAVHYRT